MKFIIDAHFPRKLCTILQEYGYQAVHTLDLPDKNYTNDQMIMQYADANDSIVITKDSDFVDAFYLHNKPQRLLLISTGNINNRDLEILIRTNIVDITQLFETYHFIELSRIDVIVHV